jgi:glycosyltransferase involved in cell wall biosynthesis
VNALNVVHITAHLGGGVGRALSGLGAASKNQAVAVNRSVVCVEAPEKDLFLTKLRNTGCAVHVKPSSQEFKNLLANADVLQLEWWNHPETIRFLVENCSGIPHRLLVWAHVSGLGSSVIPGPLLDISDRFCFTSPCSMESEGVLQSITKSPNKFDIIHSCGGFDGLDATTRRPSANLRVGYVGTLNFSKLHPDFVQFLSKVESPEFQVNMIGDTVNRSVLEDQCRALGRDNLLNFAGYSTQIADCLAEMDVLAYLLNPSHYGTTENALLEAMSMGVVPIVLSNPAERHIVTHQVNGLIISSPAEFAEAIRTLTEDKILLERLSVNARESVKERFAPKTSAQQLTKNYLELMNSSKAVVNYRTVFGTSPAEWFLSCQAWPDSFRNADWIRLVSDRFGRHALFEHTKGSVHHFARAFPESNQLSKWSNAIRELEHAH